MFTDPSRRQNIECVTPDAASSSARLEVEIVRDHAALRAWQAQLPGPWDSGTPRRVVLALPALTAAQNAAFAMQINNLGRSCGCSSGGALAVVGLLILSLRQALFATPLLSAGTARVASGLGLVVLMAALGKVGGLVWARWRLSRLLAQLEDRTGRAPLEPSNLQHRRA